MGKFFIDIEGLLVYYELRQTPGKIPNFSGVILVQGTTHVKPLAGHMNNSATFLVHGFKRISLFLSSTLKGISRLFNF